MKFGFAVKCQFGENFTFQISSKKSLATTWTDDEFRATQKSKKVNLSKNFRFDFDGQTRKLKLITIYVFCLFNQLRRRSFFLSLSHSHSLFFLSHSLSLSLFLTHTNYLSFSLPMKKNVSMKKNLSQCGRFRKKNRLNRKWFQFASRCLFEWTVKAKL